jgi:DNA-binding beta-propeller fold protein YncE
MTGSSDRRWRPRVPIVQGLASATATDERANVSLVLLAIVVASCRGTAGFRSASTAPPALTVHSIMLPGAPPEGVGMDYLAYDPIRHRVWVPAGNTGSVDVVDATSGRVVKIEGFATAQVERRGMKRTVGPSSATVGEGVIYVGNRGDSSVCAVGAESLHVGPCVRLESPPDALAYVAATREVWVTTPRDRSITVIDAAAAGTLTWTAKISLDGQPEGFAVDDGRGVFYTNLEDKDRTLRLDTRSRGVTSAWTPGCGEDGPKGLALDHGLDFLFVACRDRVMVLDAGHEGKLLSTIEVGDGIDSIDYVERRHELYAAAARAATLTIARLDPRGGLTPLAVVATVSGARNAVATDEGTAYLTDSPEGKLLVVAPVASP